MRCVSLVVVGLTLVATTAIAEPLRLADTDLDRVTADVRNVSDVIQIVEVGDYDDTIIRILADRGSNGDVGFTGVGSTTDPEHDDVDHAVPIGDVPTAAARIGAAPSSTVRVNGGDAGNPVGGSDALVLRDDDLSGAGVVIFDRGAVAGSDRSATGTGTVSRQIAVRTTGTDDRAVVQTTVSLSRTGSSDSSQAASSGGVQRSLSARNDSTGSGAGIRATSLFSGNGNSGLSASRLDTGTIARGFSASAFAGGAGTSLLNGGFN